MAKHNESWGIEVGAYAIKVMHLVREGKGVEVADYEVSRFKQVLTTPDLDVDEAVRLHLDKVLSRHDLSSGKVVVSVPGHLAFARFAKLPPVEPKKVPDIVRFEAVQQIPFPIEQVEWDYQVFQQEDSPDVEVGIFSITKERVMKFLSTYRQLGLKIDALTLSPLAVYNAFAYENAEESELPGTIYMDVGTSATDVIIVDHGGIWMRTLKIGGNDFTEALVKAFKLSFSKAERLKREAGTSKYARQIFQAMRPVFADLVQEMQRSIGYYQSMNREAELTQLVGVGSTFRLPGLTKFLKQQLQVKVIRPESFKRISVEGKQEADFAHHTPNLTTAYGLALQGLGMESVSANVLPATILHQRMWKAKQPWIAAAAASLAVAAGLAGGRYFMESSSWNGTEQRINQAVQPVINQGQGYASKWQKVAEGSDPRVRIENLRRILNYRDVWPKLMEDVSSALAAMNPQPATLSSNYAQINNIPPSQRRRFYIQSITADYRVGAQQEGGQTNGASSYNGGAAAPGGASTGLGPGMSGGMGTSTGTGQSGLTPEQMIGGQFTPDNFWSGSASSASSTSTSTSSGAGAYPAQPQGQSSQAQSESTQSQAGSSQSQDSASSTTPSETAPRFLITVTGRTPHANAVRFVSNTFIKWFDDHADRPNRPYTFSVSRKAIVRTQKITPETDQNGQGGRRRQWNHPTRGRVNPGSNGGGAVSGMYGQQRGGYRSGGQSGEKSLLPHRPTTEPNQTAPNGVTATEIEIQFLVILKPPKAARQSEEQRRTSPTRPPAADAGPPKRSAAAAPPSRQSQAPTEAGKEPDKETSS